MPLRGASSPELLEGIAPALCSSAIIAGPVCYLSRGGANYERRRILPLVLAELLALAACISVIDRHNIGILNLETLRSFWAGA